MAFADPSQDPHDVRLDALSTHLGKLLGSSPGSDLITTAGLAESFALWLILPEHLDATPPVMPREPSDFWHFQIYLNDKPAAYTVVRSAPDQMEIHEMVVSPVAE